MYGVWDTPILVAAQSKV